MTLPHVTMASPSCLNRLSPEKVGPGGPRFGVGADPFRAGDEAMKGTAPDGCFGDIAGPKRCRYGIFAQVRRTFARVSIGIAPADQCA